MVTYKVWIHIEQHDDQTDKYEDVDLEFAATAEFEDQSKANRFASILHRLGKQIVRFSECKLK